MSEIPKPPQGPNDNEAVGPQEIENFKTVVSALLRNPQTLGQLHDEMLGVEDEEDLRPDDKYEYDDNDHVWTDSFVLADGTQVFIKTPEPGYDDFEFPNIANLIEVSVVKPPIDHPDGTQTQPEETFTLNLFKDIPDLVYKDETFMRDADGKRIPRIPTGISPEELAHLLIAQGDLDDQLGLTIVTHAKFNELIKLLEQA